MINGGGVEGEQPLLRDALEQQLVLAGVVVVQHLGDRRQVLADEPGERVVADGHRPGYGRCWPVGTDDSPRPRG